MACLAATVAFGLSSSAQALEPGKIWVASWTASPQGPYPAGWPAAQPDLSFALPHGDTEGATDQTFRLIVKPDLWSKTIRLRFSNTFGSRPVTLGAVTVGLQSSGGNLLAGKTQAVLFDGKPEAVIPVGKELYSDEVALGIDPADPLLEGRNLAVSFFVKGASGPLTWHCDAFYTSYLAVPGSGDHTRDKDDAAFPFTTTSWFLLDAVEAQADPDTAVVCAFGDSITEGVNSTLNGADSWPDVLSRRLHSAYGNKIVVVKEAISGNTVTGCPRNGGTSVNGPSAGDRLDRDVLGVAGLRYVVWLEGINDLGACLVSGDDVIKGFKEVVEQLHAKKIKVIGATVVSSFGSPIGSYGFPKIDTERKKVNDFIRTSELFDAVADFDAATLVHFLRKVGLGSLTSKPVMTALLRLKITPNAPANAVLGESAGVIRLKLQAPAVEGKANAALVAFLAEALRVPKAAVSLKGGRRSRLKQVEVQGLDGAEACRRLLATAGASQKAETKYTLPESAMSIKEILEDLRKTEPRRAPAAPDSA